MKSKISNDKPKRTKRIVVYSSESSDDESETNKKLKLDPPKLPLPLSITRMFDGRESTEDSSHHQGRKRTFPHLRGNWASYVYLRVDPMEQLDTAASAVVRELALSEIEFKPQTEFHISLSRTLAIPHHWISPILASLSKLANSYSHCPISFCRLKLLTNEEKSRSFVGLDLDLGGLRLESMVSGIDEILEGYKLPKFYRPISLHASIAWGLGDLTGSEKAVAALERVWGRDLSRIFDGSCFDLDCLWFKTGHKLYSYPFKK